MDWIFTLAFVGALGSGLMAGMFYVFSFCIMPALGRLSPESGIRAMQAINITVIVPIFLGVFLGMAVLGIAAVVVGGLNLGHSAGWALIAGGLFYVLGTFSVTMTLNVPRNDALARVAPESVEGADFWRRYLSEWSFWNHIRALAGFLALAAFVYAAAAA